MTEDMCVTHFLIQPDPEGVKLQGWNERAFSEEGEREGGRGRGGGREGVEKEGGEREEGIYRSRRTRTKGVK